MLVQTITTNTKTEEFYDGEFDAAIGLPPAKTEGEYWRGYLGYTQTTGNTPF